MDFTPKAGNEMPKQLTISEIARLAGVSAGTVDRILHNRGKVSESARNAVGKILAESGYRNNIHSSAIGLRKGFRLAVAMPDSSRGEYWFSIREGINHALEEFSDIRIDCSFSLYNRQTDSFAPRITVENGLPSNIVYRMLEDNDGLFWMTTANGLVRFDPETQAMKTFSYTDGLPETQFNYSSAYKAPDGTFYMGTINGMIAFNPTDFKKDTYTPPLYITRIERQGKQANDPSYNMRAIREQGELKLPYNQSTFTLSYVALSYTSPDAIQYAYRLEGSDKEWVYMHQNRDVTFANLSPGNYTFRVKSTNSNGTWQNNEATLRIVVTPPFWATGWAFLIYARLTVLLLVLWYNYKKAQLEEKHRVDQALFENQKEKELYNAKIQFFTFITHEIRTPLTLIKAPLEKILRSGDGTPATQENLATSCWTSARPKVADSN